MKKKTKKVCKILSVFLAFLIVAQMLPLQVLAENIANLFQNKETTDVAVNEMDDVSILYEVEEKRDEYTKVFKKSDGTYTALMTEEPLHYLNDGEWEEINNSMSLNGNLYTNLDNLFNVELPETIDSNENLTVEKDGYELSFSVDEIEESSATVENNIVVSNTNITFADEAISQTQSSVTYNNVAENTDLQYIVTPNSIKENIIVSDKESVKETYTFTFETNGLNVEKLDDGSVAFKDENDEVKFRIPRPVMTDSGLAFSYDINVALIENENGTVTLEYSPSSEWTNSSDRVYPITIDPAIMVENDDVSWVEDTWVAFDSENENSQYTNGYNDCAGGVIDTTSIDNFNIVRKNAEIYTKFNIDALKSLGNNVVFTEVQYLFVGASIEGKALAKTIESPVDLTTVTYATKPSLNDEIIDYYTSPYSSDEMLNGLKFSYIHFNLTKPLNDWYNGAENNGFAVVAGNEEYIGLFVLNGVTTSSSDTNTYTTAIVMDYVDMGGYNENLNYHSQSVGRAGTGYVNDFTQQLSVLRDDISINDIVMPITIGMIYNSATFNKMKSLGYTMMAYGNKWTPNFLRAFVRMDDNQLIYFTESGSEIDYTYSVVNGEVVFEEMYSSIYGDHEYKIEYFPAIGTEPEYIVITRPDGYQERFNDKGFLDSVINSNDTEQWVKINYDSKFRIDSISYSNNREYKYIYCDYTNLLLMIKCCCADCTCASNIIDSHHTHDINDCPHIPNNDTYNDINTTPIPINFCDCCPEINFTYDNNKNLKSVIYSDKKYVTYEYDSNNNLIAMTNIDGYRIEYDYQQISKPDENGQEIIEQTDKVIKAIEKAYDDGEYKDGKFITYERLNTNQIKLTDATGDYEIYHFGTYGNLLYTIDSDGNYVMHEDVDSTDETHFASVSDYRAFSENLLSNPSFEEVEPNGNLKNWEASKTTSMQSNDVPALFGTKVLKINSNENESVNIKQTVNIVSGGDYTFSAYVRTDEQLPTNVSEENNEESTTEVENNLVLKVYYGNTQSEESIKTESIETTKGKWERVSVTLEDVPNTIDMLTVEIEVKSGNNFYVDGAQLEQSTTASLYNYVSNGSFNNIEIDENNNDKYIIDSWSYLNTLDAVTETVIPENINGKTVNALVLPGGENKVTEICQTISIDGKKNDVIRVGGWFKGNYVKSETNNVWLKNIINEANNTKICNFTEDRYAQIEVSYQYIKWKNNISEIIEEKVLIPISENIEDWQYASKEISLKGNCDTVTVVLRYSNKLQPAMFSNVELTKKKIRTTTYDSNDKPCPCVKCTIVDCSCSCDSELYCYCSQCMQREQNIKDYNFANMSLGNNNDEIISTQMLTQRVGNNVTVNFNLSNGLLKSVYDATKTYSSYIYNNSGTITRISSDNSNVIFRYYNDKLQSINQNGTIYNFNYDIWGQLTQVSIDSTPLVSYKYGSYENRDRIIEVCYHNNDSTNNTTTFDYNDELNIITISINEQEKFTCNYDENGLLTEIFDVNGREVYYTVNGTEIYDSPNNLLYSSYQKNNGDIIETIDNSIFTTNGMSADGGSGSYHDNRNIISKNGEIIGVTANIDDVGRYSSSIVQTEKFNDNNPDNEFAAIINATDYDSTEKSILYETCAIYDNEINMNSMKTSYYRTIYDYDDNGNIIQKTVKNAIDDTIISNTSYAYTNQNQLTRVNDETNNITYYYSYTAGGNIDYIQEYPYTTGELKDTDVDKTINYNYTKDVWKDRLTDIVCDEQTLTNITYDSIGNPLTINGKTLTWNGKQLKTYVDGNKAINYEYDVNGFCYKKTVTNNNVTEIYDYIWNEGKLISQVYNVINENTSEKYILKFAYDVFGTPYGFIVNDPNNNETVYLFMKNLEGDIVGIANEYGNTVLTYEYNIWGVTKTNTDNIGNEILKNIVDTLPLRYRGYCYDNDTGLYYIQGRYYSPEICRFINADNTSNLGSTGTALSYNLYAYCENNPMMYVVDNKNNEFSNTINSNYLYNKSISDNISGYIDDQGNGVASKLRYGLDSIGPVGCGCVASYNALIMLGNRIEIHDIIREYELNSLMYYGKWGVYPYNIARFFTSRGYKVTITDLREFDLKNKTNLTDSDKLNQIVRAHDANIMLYTHSTAAHYIALKYDEQIDKFVKYNINKTSDNVKDFISSDDQARLLISISVN